MRFKGCNHPTRLSARPTAAAPFGSRRSLSLGNKQAARSASGEQADRFPALRAMDGDLQLRRGNRSP